MGGLFMIAASARLLLPVWVPPGHGGMVTCGTWPLQVANAGPTASTVLAQPTPRSSAAGPLIPLSVKGKHLHNDPANRGSAGNGTTHSVRSQAVSTSMPV